MRGTLIVYLVCMRTTTLSLATIRAHSATGIADIKNIASNIAGGDFAAVTVH